MNHEEIMKLAHDVLDGKPKSYVEASKQIAAYLIMLNTLADVKLKAPITLPDVVVLTREEAAEVHEVMLLAKDMEFVEPGDAAWETFERAMKKVTPVDYKEPALA